MLIKYLFIALISFLASTIATFLLHQAAKRRELLTPKGVPLVGGIAIGLSFFVASLLGLFLWGNLSSPALGIMIAPAIMLVFGVIDDLRELSVLAKFLVQVVAIVLLISLGIKTQIAFFDQLINLLVTFIWILAITNAFNHLDVMDGLAAGTAIIVSLAFFLISLLNGDTHTAILSLALSVATSSFLIYNLPPAKVYMGNSGSHFLGFTLAAIALFISYAPSSERKIALLSPLLILGLPIFDTGFLILMRIKQGRSIFKKSNDHPALRFLKLGYPKNKTLLLMLLLCLFFSSSGVLLSQVSNSLGIIIISLVILVSLIVTFRLNKVYIDG
jgi:UDP-GlcNAc:undecaprenyl-phosphate GlcNAc-1-phosphate transferase